MNRKRRKISRRRSKKIFKKGHGVHRKNYGSIMRGGIRM